MNEIKIPRKLIETTLPLDDINTACGYEKMPGIGPHPRGIHLWWARRPLAAARAIIFAQMVNDPSHKNSFGGAVTKQQIEKEREYLFQIIRDLVKWQNLDNEHVLDRAREAIKKSWCETCQLNKDNPQAAELFNPAKLPAFYDPFAGGGALPLEAQRLGLEAHASDLNPLAVLISKAMIEIPLHFANKHPIGPLPKNENQASSINNWSGINGIAEDVRRYGHWMQEEFAKRVGDLYPRVRITGELTSMRQDLKKYKGEELRVIAWLWARTVKSPSPAFSDIDVPLASTFLLSNKDLKTYIEPVVSKDGYQFTVKIGNPHNLNSIKSGTKTGRGAKFRCLMSNSPITNEYIKAEANAGRMGMRLMAIVAKGKKERVYLSPTSEHEAVVEQQLEPNWRPMGELVGKCRDQLPLYGINTFEEIFTRRQLVALTTLADLVIEVREKIVEDAMNSGMGNCNLGLSNGGTGAIAYGDAISVYLAFCVDRCVDFNNSLTRWLAKNEKVMYLFSRQAIQMAWDFGEANILENVVGGFITNLNYQVNCILKLPCVGSGFSFQQNAITQNNSRNKVISTDPPYYNNIQYADLSDFFVTTRTA